MEFNDCFPGATIHYAMKANSEPEILKTLNENGSSFEVASIYELNILKEIGVSPEKIIYGTSVKPSAHIKEFFKFGVDRFAFDSLSELEKIASVVPGSKVYVRVSVNDIGSVFRFSEKFGTSIESIAPLLIHAKELGLKPYGISFHVGSQTSNPLAWANALQNLIPIMHDLKRENIKLEVINIGGGFPCKYNSSERELNLKEIADSIYKQCKKFPYKVKLILEPGRGIVASAGVLMTSVISKIERSGNSWLFLDAGVYNALFEAMAYQGSTKYRIGSLRHSYDSANNKQFSLAGPTGDSPDVITREALLPQDISVGDKLIVHDVGAYSLVVSSRFNGFPKPSVYFI